MKRLKPCRMDEAKDKKAAGKSAVGSERTVSEQNCKPQSSSSPAPHIDLAAPNPADHLCGLGRCHGLPPPGMHTFRYVILLI